jgi:hypothetical protein
MKQVEKQIIFILLLILIIIGIPIAIKDNREKFEPLLPTNNNKTYPGGSIDIIQTKHLNVDVSKYILLLKDNQVIDSFKYFNYGRMIIDPSKVAVGDRIILKVPYQKFWTTKEWVDGHHYRLGGGSSINTKEFNLKIIDEKKFYNSRKVKHLLRILPRNIEQYNSEMEKLSKRLEKRSKHREKDKDLRLCSRRFKISAKREEAIMKMALLGHNEYLCKSFINFIKSPVIILLKEGVFSKSCEKHNPMDINLIWEFGLTENYDLKACFKNLKYKDLRHPYGDFFPPYLIREMTGDNFYTKLRELPEDTMLIELSKGHNSPRNRYQGEFNDFAYRIFEERLSKLKDVDSIGVYLKTLYKYGLTLNMVDELDIKKESKKFIDLYILEFEKKDIEKNFLQYSSKDRWDLHDYYNECFEMLKPLTLQ